MNLPRRHLAKLPRGRGVNLAAITAAEGVGVNLAALGLAGGSEADFQAVVIQIATAGGWEAFGIPDSRLATATGFQDLTLKHDTGPVPIIVAELKRVGEKPRPDQVAWHEAWERAGVPVYVWTPADIETIREVLK